MQTASWSPKKRRRFAVGGALLALLLIAIGVLAGFTSKGDKGDFARGTSVLGIDISGLDRSDAAARLHAGLDGKPEMDKPITVHITGDSAKAADAQVVPDQVGLGVDVDGSVAAAADDDGHAIAPVVNLDASKLDAALRPTVDKVTADAATPASVTFEGLTPKVTYPSSGQGVDIHKTAEIVKTGWVDAVTKAGVAVGGTVPSPGQPGAPTVSVPLVTIDNAKARAEVDRLVDSLAKPAVAAPVTVHSAKGDVTITPEMIAKSLKITGTADGTVTPAVDPGALRTAMGPAISTIESSPPSAVKGQGASQQVLVSTAGGQYVDGNKLATDVLGVLPKTTPRTVDAVLNPAPAQVNDANLQKLGVKEKVSSFTTKFTGGLTLPRVHNIVTVANKVDGAIVKPGETFSLNGYTGWRGYEQGYVDAPVIENNKLVPAVGGGISQFTTTIFNASYYAGLKDVEHKPHSFYISNYPSVIESTIFWPDLDLKFQNTTPYGILIDTSYTNDSVTVSMWSTKVYDSVKTEYGPKHDVVKPESKTLPAGPECIATAGSDGFAQDAYRVIRKDGKEVQREKFTWRYDAEPRYTCAKPDPAKTTDQVDGQQPATDQSVDPETPAVTPPATSGWVR